MARRKKSPATATIEAILWHDADGKFRQVLDTSPVLNHTVGFVVFEDERQVVLAHEVAAVDEWIEQEMDYTKIPLVLVQRRVKLGELSIQPDDEAANSAQ